MSGDPVTNFRRSTRLCLVAMRYHPGLDRDHDGIASEKHLPRSDAAAREGAGLGRSRKNGPQQKEGLGSAAIWGAVDYPGGRRKLTGDRPGR